MSTPPREIDGARVLHWAWSGSTPFGVVRFPDGTIAAEIFGLAICQYSNSDVVYRFSCNAEWETEQDHDYASAQEAMDNLPMQYRELAAVWHKFE